MLEHFGKKEIRIGELYFDITRNEPAVKVEATRQISPAIEKALEEVRKFSYRGQCSSSGWRERTKMEKDALRLSPAGIAAGGGVAACGARALTPVAQPHPNRPHRRRTQRQEARAPAEAPQASLGRYPPGRLLLYGRVVGRRPGPLDASEEIILDEDVSPETMNYLFVHLDDWHEGASKAEQYIQRLWDANPIRQNVLLDMFQ